MPRTRRRTGLHRRATPWSSRWAWQSCKEWLMIRLKLLVEMRLSSMLAAHRFEGRIWDLTGAQARVIWLSLSVRLNKELEHWSVRLHSTLAVPLNSGLTTLYPWVLSLIINNLGCRLIALLGWARLPGIRTWWKNYGRKWLTVWSKRYLSLGACVEAHPTLSLSAATIEVYLVRRQQWRKHSNLRPAWASSKWNCR